MNITKLLLVLLFFSHVVSGNTIWSGENADLNISWTSEDIIATKAGKTTFSAKELAKQDFEADFMGDNSSENCNYEREFILLSVVGNIANFQETEYVNCNSTPHPSIITKFVARDLISGSKVMLTNFFNESDLVKALKNDDLIKSAFAKNDSEASTARLSDIVNNLRDKDISEIGNPNQLMLNGLFKALEWSEIMVNGCGYRLAKDFLNQFAFHHLNRGRVAIRLNLLPNAPACQTQNVQLGLYLPIPTSLKVALKHADKETTGFLMSKAIKGRTEISFATNNSNNKKAPKIVPTVSKGDMSTALSVAAKPSQPKTIKELVVDPHSEITIFTVRSGHTLYDIGRRFGCTIADIANWNNLQRPYRIYVGQKLNIITNKLSKHKLVTASGINVRSKPKLKKHNVVEQLHFGAIVKQLARTRNPKKAGRFYNYWYKIKTNTGKTGWIFGQYLSEFVPVRPEKRAKFYFQIAKKRAKKKMDLPNQINLVNFLTAIKDDMQASPKRAAKIAMLHLRSLTKLIAMSKVDKYLDKTVDFIKSTQQSQILNNNKYLSKELDKLKAIVSETNYAKKDDVIKQIDQWMQSIN
ncbi:LysM peptidoglycan-binding domain-containing protein [Candidatus Halobeggiatoa sp. HSG11]|nr:LysM peptidoglycan-binding domain-containing protein [Candidatus Halobeggiatoa sp. HSG11]